MIMTIIIENGELRVQNPVDGIIYDFDRYEEKFQKAVIALIKETISEYGY